MRGDDALLLDMLIDARKIQRFVAGMTFTDFQANEMAQSAVVREFQVIGEAARMISGTTQEACAEIDWRAIAGMRNRLIHEYFAVRLNIIWTTTQSDIAPLIAQLERYVPPDLGSIE